jgi:hypothetical protein
VGRHGHNSSTTCGTLEPSPVPPPLPCTPITLCLRAVRRSTPWSMQMVEGWCPATLVVGALTHCGRRWRSLG